MANSTYKAVLYPNSGLSIDTFNGGAKSTPGNVGVCLSGGGSRALTAGMGQLRALDYLCTSNGKSLLSQTKALSTVSGGSWLGITFEMQSKYSKEAYLNSYTADPSTLTNKSIGELSEGNIGKRVTSGFSVPDIALQALFYHFFSKTPADMLWQTVIAKHILAPYGLYEAGRHQAPTQAFTYDSNSRDQILNISEQNQALRDTDFLTLSTNNVPPYFICNTAMFVNDAEPKLDGYQYLAPVQCTPFFTGIVGQPGGVDANGKAPGGGGVDSFAFNSTLQSVTGSSVSVEESRPWSIMDCVGASSSAFAETLVNLFSQWQKSPSEFLTLLADRGHENLGKVLGELHTQDQPKAQNWLKNLLNIDHDEKNVEKIFAKITEHDLEGEIFVSKLQKLIDGVVPRYNYWPVSDATPEANVKPSKFADAGSLENTGVASLLSYNDIDNVIAFVNSPTPLSPATTSGSITPLVTVDEKTQVITTDIIVDGQMPPLFGYQPYVNGQYIPYDSGKNISKSSAWGVNNQVFPCKDFIDFLTGIWSSAQGSKAPAIYKQTTSVLENSWFGVPARDSLTCVWVYLNNASDWEVLLNEDVQQTLNGIKKFPNYSTLNTELKAYEINLLSSMSAWSVGNDDNKSIFIDLFNT